MSVYHLTVRRLIHLALVQMECVVFHTAWLEPIDDCLKSSIGSSQAVGNTTHSRYHRRKRVKHLAK